ncbi:hypothetical protein QC763_0027100 [Podospora pseudopauciseta]|uniref:Uncharacterized protein n=1 Tax=Podospora pseudopauciseta TaxID=2093780 RepID=A0ABR0I2U6_9PEZI|nr:hypothetical protein QC763_0027100 [Podospora pseudopauciseta]
MPTSPEASIHLPDKTRFTKPPKKSTTPHPLWHPERPTMCCPVPAGRSPAFGRAAAVMSSCSASSQERRRANP